MWDKGKFERWREEETQNYKGKMGYVKFGAKGRGEVEGEYINKHSVTKDLLEVTRRV